MQVAEIKRINNMMQDQDFYAFTKIKVPLKKYSFLTEVVNKSADNKASNSIAEHRTWNGTVVDETLDSTDHESAFQDTDTECNLSDPETQRLLIKKSLSIKQNINSQSREAKRFLRNMDKDLTKICQSARSNRNSLNEVVSVLTDRTIQPLRRKKTYFNGADCGVTWWSISLCVLICVIVIPLLIMLYLWKTGILFQDSKSSSHGWCRSPFELVLFAEYKSHLMIELFNQFSQMDPRNKTVCFHLLYLP